MNFSAFDHECMALALRLAARGLFTTRPNPRVGCVIAGESRVIATGWHEFAGGPHAEAVALERAGAAARGASVYVTLEPCSHHGRTPPCADALVRAGVGRVVIAAADPNRAVNGAGRKRLEAAGIMVESGLLAQAAEELNAGFLMRMRAGRPWVRVKLAISLDGRTGLRRGASRWISSEASRRDVQDWRARSCALLTGVGTVRADDPALTARIGEPPLRPLRVVLDTRWQTPPGSRLLDQPASALIAGSREVPVPDALAATGVRCLPLPELAGRVDPLALLQALAAEEINEVQVEAGATLSGALLRAGLVDEILLYQAPILLGEGGPGPFTLGELESMDERTHLEVLETCHIGADLRYRLRPGRGRTQPHREEG
jgi:diaminohydroxyphosphoribosylaminopyrimidine deaminase/5-amino-6-(5-phosphoribosylamino)uracil reductase